MRIPVIIAAAAVCLACVSCSVGSSSKKEHPDITGMWSVSEDGFDGGYIFGDNGVADIYIYPADTYYGEGGMFISGTHIPEDNMKYDGKKLSISLLETELITAERIGEPDEESCKGDYLMTGGTIRESIITSSGISDENSEKVTLNMEIEDERIRFTVKDIVEYSFDGSTLELNGRNGMPDSSGDAELSGDTIKVKRSDGKERILTKVKQGANK